MDGVVLYDGNRDGTYMGHIPLSHYTKHQDVLELGNSIEKEMIGVAGDNKHETGKITGLHKLNDAVVIRLEIKDGTAFNTHQSRESRSEPGPAADEYQYLWQVVIMSALGMDAAIPRSVEDWISARCRQDNTTFVQVKTMYKYMIYNEKKWIWSATT